MKKITLEDVNNSILGTDIKILSHICIMDLNNLRNIPSNLFGVYIINLKYNESYIGMSQKGVNAGLNKELKGIKSRLLSHSCEGWHKVIIESINIFITDKMNAHLLEKMMIKEFKPELNTIMYNAFYIIKDDEENGILNTSYENEYKYKYENKYGNSKFISWLKKQNKCNYNYNIRDFAIDLIYDSKENGIKFKNIFELIKYLELINSTNIDILDEAYNEYKYIYLTNYNKQYKNFGINLINSVNPELNNELNNNKTFGSNYRLWCEKYNEINTIKNKNISNIWEELLHNERENNNILDNDISYWNAHTTKHQTIYKNKHEKISIVEKNYSNLLLELKNELDKLLKRYNKNESYISESIYQCKLMNDINYYINFKNEQSSINNQQILINNQ